MGTLFLLAVALLVVDLSTGFGLFLSKAIVLRIRTAGLACSAVLVLIAHVQGLRPPAVEQYEIPVNGLPADLDGITIAILSDLHLGEMLLNADWLNARVRQVQASQPDCIVLVGDLFEWSSDPVALSPVLRQLSAPLGVFAVRGNHERLRPRRPDHAGKILTASGIRLLTNEWTELASGLVLVGIDDLTSIRRQGGEGKTILPEPWLIALPVRHSSCPIHLGWSSRRRLMEWILCSPATPIMGRFGPSAIWFTPATLFLVVNTGLWI